MSLGTTFDKARNPSAFDATQSAPVTLSFNTAEDAVTLRKAADEQSNATNLDHLQQNEGNAALAGLVPTNRSASGADTRSTKESERKKQQDAALDRAQLMLERMRETLQQELDQIDQRRTDIGKMRDGIEDVFANGYEVGEDGRITNAQAEKALGEYEKRTGKKIDRDDDTAVLAALHAQWEAFDREEVQMNRRAGEIKHYMDNDLRKAEGIVADPSTPPKQLRRLLRWSRERSMSFLLMELMVSKRRLSMLILDLRVAKMRRSKNL